MIWYRGRAGWGGVGEKGADESDQDPILPLSPRYLLLTD